MQLLLVAAAAFLLMGNKPPAKEPAPQVTAPTTPPGQNTGQIVADVGKGVGSLVELFKQLMDGGKKA